MKYRTALIFALGSLAAFACGGSEDVAAPAPVVKTSAMYKEELTLAVHASLLGDLRALAVSASDICTKAPVHPGRGWGVDEDREAIAGMKTAWYRARVAYEHIEGAISPLFPDIDRRIDARYDDFLAELGAAGDADLFDDTGVTGMHAIERILFSDVTPVRIVELERTIAGYSPARFPATEAEAASFQAKLCGKLVLDARELEASWAPQRIDIAGAFDGLVGLMTEQREKVIRASSSEEESRYAQSTLSDLRANLEGTRSMYELFRPWLQSRSEGNSVDTRVISGFEKLNGVYAGYLGDAIPTVPVGWSSESPSTADRSTPFGVLWTQVRATVDPARSDSLVQALNEVADALGLGDYKKR